MNCGKTVSGHRGIDAEIPYELRKNGYGGPTSRFRMNYGKTALFPHLMRDLFVIKRKDGHSGIDAEIPYELRKDGSFPALDAGSIKNTEQSHVLLKYI